MARFYTPGDANNDRVMGSLITRRWTRPTGAPTAMMPEAGTFRRSPFDAANDQIACAVRNVGTWSAGRGVAHGAPYLHAGNARTLEEALGPRFEAHRSGYAPTGMFEGAGGAERLRQLLVFVASIDERTGGMATPARIGGSVGPDVCGRWR